MKGIPEFDMFPASFTEFVFFQHLINIYEQMIA